jgi:hypothetical protein
MSTTWAGRERCNTLVQMKIDVDKLSISSTEKEKLKLSIDTLLQAFGCFNQ